MYKSEEVGYTETMKKKTKVVRVELVRDVVQCAEVLVSVPEDMDPADIGSDDISHVDLDALDWVTADVEREEIVSVEDA